MSLLELAEKIEKADTEEEHFLLISTFKAIHGEKPERVSGGSPEWLAWLDLYNPFHRSLHSKSYETAAISLLPEGFVWSSFPADKGCRLVQIWNPKNPSYRGFGVDIPEAKSLTFALAFCAAVLRTINEIRTSASKETTPVLVVQPDLCLDVKHLDQPLPLDIKDGEVVVKGYDH